MTPSCAVAAPAGGAFAATADGSRWTFAGSLTMDSAAAALEASRALPLPTSGVVDFATLAQADSAALAVMIAVRRRGAAEGRPITLVAVPETLMSLAVVYGVEELLGPKVGSDTTFQPESRV
jgi:phospholipid transport system transporter-binding protein